MRPTRYLIEYTSRDLWEELHRAPGPPPHSDEFRVHCDARTERDARRQAHELLRVWEFSQPQISRRIVMRNRKDIGCPDSWDWSLEPVSLDALEEDAR